MATKVLINSGFGGFGFSKGFLQAATAARILEPDVDIDELDRSDERLIAFVEEFGIKRASGPYSTLKIVEIPDGVEWVVCELYDGAEWVAEKHRKWR